MKHIPKRKFFLIFLFSALGLGLIPARGQVVVINTGTPASPLYAVGPIYLSSTMFYTYSRFAYLYTQDELAAAGIAPGAEIDQVGWMKSMANTAAGPASFSIYMKNSSTPAYSNESASWANLSAGTTTVYTNNSQSIPATATPNFINFTLSTPFTYTGGSLEILTQWDISSAPVPIATGSFEWENTTVVDRIYGNGGTSLATTLSSTNNNVSIDDKRPVIQFTLNGNTGIAAAASRPGFELYPNPADQFLNITDPTGSAIERMEVLDLLGKVIDVQGRSNGSNLRLDVSNFGPGAYFLRIQTATGPVVKRFTVR